MPKYDRVLSVGDFNIHICCPNKVFVSYFLILIYFFSLVQCVAGPTYVFLRSRSPVQRLNSVYQQRCVILSIPLLLYIYVQLLIKLLSYIRYLFLHIVEVFTSLFSVTQYCIWNNNAPFRTLHSKLKICTLDPRAARHEYRKAACSADFNQFQHVSLPFLGI